MYCIDHASDAPKCRMVWRGWSASMVNDCAGAVQVARMATRERIVVFVFMWAIVVLVV